MIIIKKEEIVYPMSSYCTYIIKVKLNNNGQINILFKTVSVIDKIVFIILLY